MTSTNEPIAQPQPVPPVMESFEHIEDNSKPKIKFTINPEQEAACRAFVQREHKPIRADFNFSVDQATTDRLFSVVDGFRSDATHILNTDYEMKDKDGNLIFLAEKKDNKVYMKLGDMVAQCSGTKTETKTETETETETKTETKDKKKAKTSFSLPLVPMTIGLFGFMMVCGFGARAGSASFDGMTTVVQYVGTSLFSVGQQYCPW
jgi:hypothetical protein